LGRDSALEVVEMDLKRPRTLARGFVESVGPSNCGVNHARATFEPPCFECVIRILVLSQSDSRFLERKKKKTGP